MTQKIAMWFNAVVGIIWIVAGLRDLFAPNFFRFDRPVAGSSTFALNIALGLGFLLCASSFRRAKTSVQ